MNRLFNFLLSLFGMLALSPVIVLTGFLVYRKMGYPVLFKQIRPGLNGEPFVFYKIRTMIQEKDADGELLPDKDRLTKFGQFLRNTSLDELPNLWCVLKGDMNFVGPRPLDMNYLGRYSPEQARRHDVTPGITGWAQINGRNDISWEEKYKLDVWYVDNRSFFLDIKIIILTILKVLKQEKTNRTGHATTEEFLGSNGSNS